MGKIIAENCMKDIDEVLEGRDFAGGRPRRQGSENAAPNSANLDQQNNA